MPISVVQSKATNSTGGGAAGTWTTTFSAGVTAGNTLFLVVFSYDSGAVISASSPTYNGTAYGSAAQLFSVLSTSSGNVFTAAYIFPNITSGGGTTVGATCTGGNVDGNVGSIAYEVSGLGTTPTVDQTATQHQNNSTALTTSGATGAIAFAPEFVLGASVGLGINQSSPSGFTSLGTNGAPSASFCAAGYQIPVASGGTYTWSTVLGGGADWSAGIVTVYAPSAAAGVAGTVPVLAVNRTEMMARTTGRVVRR